MYRREGNKDFWGKGVGRVLRKFINCLLGERKKWDKNCDVTQGHYIN